LRIKSPTVRGMGSSPVASNPSERRALLRTQIGKPRSSRPRSGPTLSQELSDVVGSMARGDDRLSELVRRACQFFAPVTNGLRVAEVHQRYSWPSCCLAIHIDSTRRADGLRPRVTSFNGVSFDVTAACDKPASEWAVGRALTLKAGFQQTATRRGAGRDRRKGTVRSGSFPRSRDPPTCQSPLLVSLVPGFSATDPRHAPVSLPLLSRNASKREDPARLIVNAQADSNGGL